MIRWILIAVLLAFAALSLYDYFQLRSGRTDRVLLLTGRGVIYPGVVLNSHGRRKQVKTALREVVFFFNTDTGRIEEKPLNE